MKVAQDPVEEYRDQVLNWLSRRARKWQHTARTATGAARNGASFYAAAYGAAVQGVIDGEPEKRAAMERDYGPPT